MPNWIPSLKGEPLSSETSINKVHRAFLAIELGDLVLEIRGNAGQYPSRARAPSMNRDLWPNGVLDWRPSSSAAATPNIQRNIIAERILGLPKD